MSNVKIISRYNIGKNKIVAVIKNKEHACPLLEHSATVEFLGDVKIDFDDQSSIVANGIKKEGYFLFPANQ